MKSSHEIVKALVRTEKSTVYEPSGKYLFLVDKAANKIQIRRAVEEIYKVKVSSVNTMITMGKLRRVRYQVGKTPDMKKAIVTLEQGHKIDVA